MTHLNPALKQRYVRTQRRYSIWYSNLIILPQGVGQTDFLLQNPGCTITLNLNGADKYPEHYNELELAPSLQVRAPYLLLIP
jgi:hypothetical protein